MLKSFKKLKRTPRGESYLWKTTHLNTAEKEEEVKASGRKNGGGKWEKGGEEKEGDSGRV